MFKDSNALSLAPAGKFIYNNERNGDPARYVTEIQFPVEQG